MQPSGPSGSGLNPVGVQSVLAFIAKLVRRAEDDLGATLSWAEEKLRANGDRFGASL